MRKIKFRAWDKKRKKMFDVYQIMFCGVNTSIKLCNPDGGISRWFDVEDRFILIQYTGLKDKKHVEIYEGDILEHQYKGKGEVIYEAPGFRVIGDDMDIWLGHCDKKKRKIIGNIYENPELMEKK